MGLNAEENRHLEALVWVRSIEGDELDKTDDIDFADIDAVGLSRSMPKPGWLSHLDPHYQSWLSRSTLLLLFEQPQQTSHPLAMCCMPKRGY